MARQWSSGGRLTSVRRPQQVRRTAATVVRLFVRVDIPKVNVSTTATRVHYREGPSHLGGFRQPQL